MLACIEEYSESLKKLTVTCYKNGAVSRKQDENHMQAAFSHMLSGPKSRSTNMADFKKCKKGSSGIVY